MTRNEKIGLGLGVGTLATTELGSNIFAHHSLIGQGFSAFGSVEHGLYNTNLNILNWAGSGPDDPGQGLVATTWTAIDNALLGLFVGYTVYEVVKGISQLRKSSLKSRR